MSIFNRQATQVLQRRKCKKRKVTRLSSLTRKLEKETTKLDTAHAMTLDKDATMCQYLMAERFVKSILGWQCRTQKKDFREISDIIMNRLMSLDGYESARDGSRATQQLHILADTIACWIVEILVEVADTRREWLQEYCKKKLMKRIEAEDDDETDSEVEIWKQMVQREQEKRKKKEEETVEDKNEKYKREENMKAPTEEQTMKIKEEISEKEAEKEHEEEYEKTEDQETEDKKEKGDVTEIDDKELVENQQ